MDFDQLILQFKESSSTQSPVWIWFEKKKSDDKLAKCRLCSTNVACKQSCTSNMVIHLKRHHGHLKTYNAWKIYEELSSLKEERLKTLKLKNCDSDEIHGPKLKQPKISSCVNPPYGPQHHRQKQITTSIASMICVDGVPTNIVN